jgi:hypothetical protein
MGMQIDFEKLKSIAIVHRGLRLDDGNQWVEIAASNKQLGKLAAAHGRMTAKGAPPEAKTEFQQLLTNIVVKFNGTVPDWLQQNVQRPQAA